MLKYIGKRQIGIVRCSEHEKKKISEDTGTESTADP